MHQPGARDEVLHNFVIEILHNLKNRKCLFLKCGGLIEVLVIPYKISVITLYMVLIGNIPVKLLDLLQCLKLLGEFGVSYVQEKANRYVTPFMIICGFQEPLINEKARVCLWPNFCENLVTCRDVLGSFDDEPISLLVEVRSCLL